MSIISKLFSGGADKLVESVGGVLDNLTTTKEEKLEAKRKLEELILNHHLQNHLLHHQLQNQQKNLKHNGIKRGIKRNI